MMTKHYMYKRYERDKFIDEHLGVGHIVDGFIVDKGHPNGAEVHSITDNAIIIVHNLETGKLVTQLLARPSQIKRYYKDTNRKRPPEYREILRLAEAHKRLGYNKRWKNEIIKW